MPVIEETSLRQAIAIERARRLGSFHPTGTISGATVSTNYVVPSQPATGGTSGNWGWGWALEPAMDVFLDFKPWLHENHRGGRAWSAHLLPEKTPVIVKCWDAYKNSEDPCNTEVGAYVTLRELSGICIPKFIVVGRVGFCHAIVLQDLEVTFLYIFSC